MPAHHVLIVDDNMMQRQLVTQQLQAIGFSNLQKVSNGLEAFAKLDEYHAAGSPFDIILLDWHMPGIDGFDFLKKCRSDLRFKDIAIVMLTAESEPKNILMALKNGATSYIVKPIFPETLEKRMQQILQWLEKGTGIREAVS